MDFQDIVDDLFFNIKFLSTHCFTMAINRDIFPVRTCKTPIHLTIVKPPTQSTNVHHNNRQHRYILIQPDLLDLQA